MPARLIIAPPAAGKTHYCLQRLRELPQAMPQANAQANAQAHPPTLAWAVLPDQEQLGYFRRRLAQQGGALGVQVSTFDYLYDQILTAAGQTFPVIGDTARYRLIQAVVQAQFAAGQLSYYAPIHTLPGFITSLRDRFAEIKAAGIFPEVFLAQVAADQPGQQELGSLYLAYQTFLQQLTWADREGLGWLAVETLDAEPAIFSRYQLIVVDGFDDFEPIQLAVLKQLARQVPWVEITLTGSPDSSRQAQARFTRTQAMLVEALAPEIIYLETSPKLPPALALLERNIFEPQLLEDPKEEAPHAGIDLLELRSPVEEANEAIRWIKAQCLRRGLSPAETAIFTPDPDVHLPYLVSAASQAGVPLNITIRAPLASSPAVRALIDLLELPQRRYPRQATLDAVRSPFFDLQPWNLAPQDAAVLERVSYETHLNGGQDQWEAAFAELAASKSEKAAEWVSELQADSDWLPPLLPAGQELARLAESFSAFFFDRLVANRQLSLDSWIAWLEDLLEDIHYPQRCDPESLSALRGVLRALLLSELAAPAGLLDYPKFQVELFSALEGAGYDAAPGNPDSGVLVAPIIAARGQRFAAVAILGLSEGIFPQVERADPFLPETLRAALGLDLRLGRYQASIFYQSVLRSNRYLLLTRPYLAEGGENWEPSPYWQAVESLFPKAVQRLRPEDWRDLTQAASPAETLFWAARQNMSDPPEKPEALLPVLPSDPSLGARAIHLQHAGEILKTRQSPRPHGLYDGYPTGLQPEMTAQYSPEHIWSASRLESYLSCPHHFWARHVLALEPLQPPEPGMDPAQLGSLLHSLLEQAYAQAKDRTDPQTVAAALHALAPEVFADAPQKYGFRPGPLWTAECEFWLQKLEDNIYALAETAPGWTPAFFEARFGLEGQPVLEIVTPAGKLRLRGLIDRVDQQDHQLRVIDYKTGSSHLAPKDLLDGVRLQLPIYALAAEALGMGEVIEGFYWQLRQAKPGSLRLSSFSAEDYPAGPSGAAAITTDHLTRAVEGIRAAEFPPTPPSGGCPAYCPAAAWCWHYQPAGW
ncbi:MAG: PD-(D/E)XK nuclease family protein [Anaerolineales bacterium]